MTPQPVDLPCVNCLCIPMCRSIAMSGMYHMSVLELKWRCSLIADYLKKSTVRVAGQPFTKRVKAYDIMKHRVYHYLKDGRVDHLPLWESQE